MKKFIKVIGTLLLMTSLVSFTTACDDNNTDKILVTSRIEDKHFVTITHTYIVNKVPRVYITTHYYFNFIEKDNYEFSVDSSDFHNHEIGEHFTITFSDTKENRELTSRYFFDSSIVYSKNLQ